MTHGQMHNTEKQVFESREIRETFKNTELDVFLYHKKDYFWSLSFLQILKYISIME